jgi:two-component system NarL family sensor kinase
MLGKRICFFSCFIFSFHFLNGQSLQEQLGAIDKINNDSAALEMLRDLSVRNVRNDKTLLEINYRLVVRANTIRDFGTAIKVSNESIVIANELREDSMEAYFTKLLGISYYLIDQKIAAIPYFQKAAKIARKNGFWALEASCYNNIGGVLTDKLQFAQAEIFLLRSIGIMREHGAEEYPAALITYRILARLYTQSKRSDKGEIIYSILIQKARNTKDTILLASSLCYYTDILRERGEYNQAIKYGEEALSLAKKKDDPNMKQLALSVHSRTLALVNRYKEAYELLKEASVLVRANFTADLQKEVSNLEVFYKTEQLKRDKEQSEERAKKQQLIYILSFAGSILFITFGIYVWNQRKNQRQKLLLQNQKFENLIEREEKERLRMARELHDGIVQDLTAIKLKLQNKEASSFSSEETLKELDAAISEVRNISYRMMPVALKQYGLIPALEDLLRKTALASSIQYEFELITMDEKESLYPTIRLPEKIELCLYRVAQELLNNVIKHSDASFVSVTVTKHLDKITLFCEDNGKGFDESNIKKGIGMNSLVTRLQLLNGSISFQSPEDGGTLVIASIPLN